jgi:hypothetical protein
MKTKAICAVILAAAVSTAPAMAHHSGAMFDAKTTVKVTGKVREFQYTNPHSWLLVDAQDAAGQPVIWAFEAEGPSTLLRAGIKRTTLKPGDAVTVATHPLRDGRPGGAWICLIKGSEVLVPSPGRPDTDCR